MDIKIVLDFIRNKYKDGTKFLIGIDGRSGSGKTYLAEQIKNAFTKTEIISLDVFDMYKDWSGNEKIISEILNINKNGIFIFEGVFALNSKLESYYHCKIWVECPAEIGYERGLKRDINLNGIDNSDQWKNYWMPKEQEYINKEKPQNKADLIVTP
jgi:uridine kinase